MMVLTAMRIQTVTPRGGKDGTHVVVTGSGFGIVTGVVQFDPLGDFGGPVNATVALWQDDRIEYYVPVGYATPTRANKFHTVLLSRVDISDGTSHRWWVPAAPISPALPPSTLGLDYQWPGFEEGTPEEDDDSPTRFQAADFNRLLDQILTLIAELAVGQSDIKQAVDAASTADLGGTYLSTGGTTGRGLFTNMPSIVDGFPVVTGSRILVKNQLAGDENGIWEVTTPGTGADGVWDRAADFDEDHEVTSGAFVVVVGGGTHFGQGWYLATPDPITIGGPTGTVLTWSQLQGGGGGGPAVPEYQNRVCDPSVQLRDLVYVQTNGILNRAAADSPVTAPAIGFVSSKSDATHCNVRYGDIISGFSGLTPGRRVWMGRLVGTITQSPDTDLITPSDVVQTVGIAIGTGDVAINIDTSLILLP